MLGFMRARMMRAAAWSVVLLGVAVGGSAHAKLEIDFFDTANFNKKNELVFFLDLLRDDETSAVYRDQDPGGDGFKIQIDGEDVAGAWSVQTFREANQAMSVAVLMAAHGFYAQMKDDKFDLLAEERQGFKDFFGQLTDQDRVLAKFYNDKELASVSAWTSTPGEVGGKVETLVKPVEDAEGPRPPRLFSHIKKTLEEFEADSEGPRRKIMVIFTDGEDVDSADTAKVEKKVTEIVERATALGVRIYIISAQDGAKPEVTGALQAIASRTRGVYREWWHKSELSLSETIKGLGTELANQYVATFKPAEYRGSEEPVDVLLEVTPTKGNGPMKRKLDKQKIPLRDTDWGGIAKIAGLAVGGLLGVVLLFLGIRWLARRKPKDAPVQQEEAFAGPYKGRLLVTAGAYAGREFFITEEVTTIGSMAGNSIVLAEGGVSKRHAGIKVDDMRFELADLGSTNGTYVNGAKVTKQFLRDGDELRLGENKLKFSLK